VLQKLKILNASHNYFVQGGSDQYFLALEDLLRDHGHEVVPFCASNPLNRATQYSRFFPDSPDFSNAGIGDIPRFIYSRQSASLLRNLLKEAKPDIAHLHIYYGKLTASILAPLKDAGVPVVQTVHEYKLICPVYTLTSNEELCGDCCVGNYWPALRKRCNRQSLPRSLVSMVESYASSWMGDSRHIDRFIAVSQFVKERLIGGGVPAEKIVVAHNFVDTDFWSPGGEAGNYVLFSGRIVSLKGVFTLLKAMARLPHIRAIIVGDGPDRQKVGQAIADHGLSNVELRQFSSRNDIRELVRGAICSIVPSEWYEPFGLVAIESMACGRPVIAAQIGGLAEIVRDDENGLRFQPGSVDELETAILKLHNNRQLATDLGAEGRRDVERRFSRETHYQKLDSIYSGISST